MKEPGALIEELNRLKNEKSAFKAQSKLLEKFVSLARSPGKDKMLIKILQKTLEVFAGLTGGRKRKPLSTRSQGRSDREYPDP